MIGVEGAQRLRKGVYGLFRRQHAVNPWLHDFSCGAGPVGYYGLALR